jgi:glycosyltransferase involved in cell wall biosynthesis/2-polyprenyl-3-methyl-5-hydroxy-6-metoxy-1,4-benzoquinol methylase
MKKTIGFATRGMNFNGNSTHSNALGGSESAIIYMARELARLGHHVYVYCECDAPGIYDNVIYNDISNFESSIHFEFDVFFISRFLQITPKYQFSKLTLFWMHDIFHEIFTEYAHLADGVFLMSNYQKALWTDINQEFGKMIYVTKNGYDSELVSSIQPTPFLERRGHYIYASRPERGLIYLLENIWPKIIEQNPSAILHLCGYSFESLDDTTNIKINEIKNQAHAIIEKSKNIINHGELPKPKYYELLSKCSTMLYPTDFPEISCINAIEAQALGCRVVSTADFAMLETVKTPNILIKKTNEYDTQFIQVALNEYEVSIDMTEYSWSNIAKTWDDHIDQMFLTRYNENKEKINKQLQHYSDYNTLYNLGIINHKKLEKQASTNLTQQATLLDPNLVELSPRHQMIIKAIGEYLIDHPSVRILDVGPESGILIATLLKAYGKNITEIIAYDINQAYLNHIQTHCNNEKIRYICDNITNLDAHKLSVDIIVAGEVLEHLPNYYEALCKIQQSLVLGGIAIFSTPIGPWSSMESTPDEHVNHFELLDLFAIFENHINSGMFFIHSFKSALSFRNELLANFVFGFHNNLTDTPTKLTKQHYLEKATKTRPYQSLSACLIVKNEEANILRCLKSIEKICDNIIIVDTGSTDRTKLLASFLTKKVYDFKWTNSFSEARNYSISKTTDDWILCIDADEEMVNQFGLTNYLRSPYFKAYTIQQKQILLDYKNNSDQHPIRLFHRDSQLSFQGRIHELLKLPNGDELAFKLFIDDSFIMHYGYLKTETITSEKIQRNHDLLMKDIADNPNKVSNYMYYIRDMRAFYELNPNNAFKNLAYDTWNAFPVPQSKEDRDYWLNAFYVIQDFRKIDRDNFLIKTIKNDEVLVHSELEYQTLLGCINT